MIKAVIFDVDGVLIDSFNANLKLYQNLMAKAGYPLPTRKDYLENVHLTLIDCIKTFTRSENIDEINRIFEWRRTGEVEYPLELLSKPKGMQKTIEKLRKKYLLGIVTNRIKERIFEIPQLEKIKKYFKVIISYQDTINHKPHPEPLLLALEKIKLKPEECVYIGDQETDIQAAKSAGMKAIIYSKKIFPNADFCTKSFEDLPKIIKNIKKSTQI